MRVDLMGVAGSLLLALVVFVLTMRAIRRHANKPRPLKTNFDLAQLRDMLQSGTIRPDEFERLKEVILRKEVPMATAARGFEVVAQPPKLDPGESPPAQ